MVSCGFKIGSSEKYMFRRDWTRCLEFVNSSRFNILPIHETWARCLCVGAHNATFTNLLDEVIQYPPVQDGVLFKLENACS